MKIRHSAKAIIIKNGKLLVTENKDNFGTFYLLPGGGQKHGEDLHQALKRECYEEIGIRVEPKELIYLREYIGKNHEFHAFDGDVHKIEYIFLCKPASEDEPQAGRRPDQYQTGVTWLPLADLMDYRFYPKAACPLITERFYIKEHIDEQPVYLGDVN
ncbi:NUDIX domain-containing protein [Scopulibacillus cellulosilyticus]|uniref:NUDIX domain-containing protein n=1 Tax=Scopulibacillus cellulosilyticus TaxID=2665665 RepID=A0ABW2PZE7_9BACL